MNLRLFDEPHLGLFFEEALWSMAASRKWDLYAYTILPGSFHLVCRTPGPDLPTGMKWLIGNYAAYYNRSKERFGHVFSGRYRNLLVENSPTHLLPLVNFVHAAPVRKGLTSIDQLHQYVGNSFGRYWAGHRSSMLDHERLLALLGENGEPWRSGMKRYRDHLAAAPESNPAHEGNLIKRFCYGWYIGSPENKIKMAHHLTKSDPHAQSGKSKFLELNESIWESKLLAELARLKKTEKHIKQDIKGADWKIKIACKLRRETSANNPWIARRLRMGHPNRVSMGLKAMREEQ